MWTSTSDRKVKKHQHRNLLSSIWIALFADDASLMTQGGQVELQRMMSAFHQACNAFGLTVSVPKTVVMAKPGSSTIVYIDGKALENVESSKYLGAKATPDGKSEGEVKRRRQLAWVAFYRYIHWFKCRKLSYKHKIALYYTYVLTVLLYGCEAWTLTTELENRLRRTQPQMLRVILHAPRRHDNQPQPSTATQMPAPTSQPPPMSTSASDRGDDINTHIG